MDAENLTVYSPLGRPVIVYSPLAFVVAHRSAALLEAHTFASAIAPLPAASVTVPVILPPGSSAASTPDAVAPALTDTGVASEAVALPL